VCVPADIRYHQADIYRSIPILQLTCICIQWLPLTPPCLGRASLLLPASCWWSYCPWVLRRRRTSRNSAARPAILPAMTSFPKRATSSLVTTSYLILNLSRSPSCPSAKSWSLRYVFPPASGSASASACCLPLLAPQHRRRPAPPCHYYHATSHDCLSSVTYTRIITTAYSKYIFVIKGSSLLRPLEMKHACNSFMVARVHELSPRLCI
jgi:hypothetical protein